MKKIILILMIFVSVSFAECPSFNGTETCKVYQNGSWWSNPVLVSTRYEGVSHSYCSWWGGQTLISENPPTYDVYYPGDCNTNTRPVKTFKFTYQMPSENNCGSGYILENGICNFITPTCVTGSHYDTTLKICASDFQQDDKYTFENGNFIVYWADGAETYCDVSEEKCITHDKNFKVIPNRYLNPELAPDGTISHGGLVPNSLPVSSWGSAVYDTLGKPLVNAAGFVLQALGTYIAIEATGSGSYLVNPTGLNSINPFAVLGAGLFTLGSAMVTPDEVVVATPTNTDNGVKVNVSSNSGVSFDSLSAVSSSTPENGTPAFSPNGIYTYKQITDANLKTVWDTAGGVGKLPPTALVLGSDIIYPTNNPNTAIINSPTQIEVVKTSPDNTAQSIVINKADLANTASSGTDLPYTVKDYQAPVINNNGTVTQASTSTPSSLSPTTGNNTSTNPTTGQTTTQNASNASGVATTSDGKSIDLSGIKGSIDQLGNQLNKLNASSETVNGILNGIKSDTGSMKGSLNGIEGSINSIKDLLSNGDVATTPHNLPTDTSAVNWNTYSSAWDNIKSSFSNVNDKVTEVTGLFQNGFQLDLTRGAVTSCAYQTTIDFGYFQIPFEYDLCASASPYRAIFYTFFYLLFSVGILSFSINAFLRLV